MYQQKTCDSFEIVEMKISKCDRTKSGFDKFEVNQIYTKFVKKN